MEDLSDVPDHWFARDGSAVELCNLLSPASRNTEKEKYLGKVKLSHMNESHNLRGKTVGMPPYTALSVWRTGQVTTHAFTRAQHPSWAGEQGWGSESSRDLSKVTCRVENRGAEGGSGCGALGLPQQQATPTLSADSVSTHKGNDLPVCGSSQARIKHKNEQNWGAV